MTEAHGPEQRKAAAIDRFTRAAQTQFERWSPTRGEPFIPEPVLSYLIPPSLLSLTQNPEAVRARVTQRLLPGNTPNTRVLIIEESDTPVTNAASFEEFRQAFRDYRTSQGTPNPLPEVPFPDDVDPLHWQFRDEIDSGELTLNDRVLLDIDFSSLSPEHLYITSYTDRPEPEFHRDEERITTDFNHRLIELAKKLGYKYISEEIANRKDIGFYVNQLGRKSLTTLRGRVQKKLIGDLQNENAMVTDFNAVTVTEVQ